MRLTIATALVLTVAASCQEAHTVTLQLGPTEDTLTVGFTCVQDADPTKLLAARAVRADGSARFAVVVDIIDLGGRLPGCRGEELLAACDGGRCTVTPRADGTRYCRDITLDASAITAAGNGNLTPMLTAIRTQLQMEAVTLDAPDHPVVIRSVGTTDSCATLADTFVADNLLGCAYSCPVQLDGVDDAIALSLDTLTRGCEREVRACAGFF